MALVSAAPALAQTAPLRVGEEIQGELTAEDPKVSDEQDGYSYDLYSFRAEAGQRLEAIMRAANFDAFLEVYEAGTPEDILASDDDGLMEGTDSRLRWTAPEDGDYVLRARSLVGPELGTYTLSLKQRPPAPQAPAPGSISVGQTIQGVIDDGDPIDDGDVPYDAYAFSAAQGQRFAIRLNADDFDPIVRVGTAGEFSELGVNDDAGGGGLNSYLVFTAPEAGQYVVRAAPLISNGAGGYTLSLEDGPEPVAAISAALGDTIEGELGEGDGVSEGGHRADAYRFSAEAGQRVTLSMSSEAFDTYLQLYRETEGGRELVAEDDDGMGDSTHSRIDATLADGGVYVLEARGFTATAEGAYTLVLEAAQPDPEPTPLAFGATIQGEITEDDPTDSEGRSFDAYSFAGQVGQRVQAIMRSGDFDTFAQIGRPGGEFEALAQDDDGLMQGTDSRLTFLLPETGDYVLRASPLGSDTTGLYSLELIDRGPQPAPGSLLIGATARGSLTEADAMAEDGSFYDAYRMNLKAGEKLRITMVSNAFDSVIYVGEDKENAFEALAQDDDSLSDTHARLDWAPEADGVYVIRAGSFAAGQTGAYALTVERKP